MITVQHLFAAAPIAKAFACFRQEYELAFAHLSFENSSLHTQKRNRSVHLFAVAIEGECF